MFRIPAAQLLANHWIGVRPEASQVVSNLGHAHVGGEQVHEDWDFSASQAGRIEQTEDFLDADSQRRIGPFQF